MLEFRLLRLQAQIWCGDCPAAGQIGPLSLLISSPNLFSLSQCLPERLMCSVLLWLLRICWLLTICKTPVRFCEGCIGEGASAPVLWASLQLEDGCLCDNLRCQRSALTPEGPAPYDLVVESSHSCPSEGHLGLCLPVFALRLWCWWCYWLPLPDALRESRLSARLHRSYFS